MEAGKKLALIVLLGGFACVRPPNIVVTGQKTALENQAAGEFHVLENDLHQAGVSPRAESIPREQLVSQQQRGSQVHGELAQLYAKAQQDADWIDRMLTAQCIGEALTSLLKHTPENCGERINATEMTRIIGRANLHRRQLWRLVQRRRPQVTESQIRSQWRHWHLQQVVCGGWVEQSDGVWNKKTC